MNIEKSTVILIDNMDSTNGQVKMSRIRFDEMFGRKEFKSDRYYLEIWNETFCPIGEYPKHYKIRAGFSNDFKHAAMGIIGTKFIGEMIIGGAEVYAVLNTNGNYTENELMTFEDAVRACIED